MILQEMTVLEEIEVPDLIMDTEGRFFVPVELRVPKKGDWFLSSGGYGLLLADSDQQYSRPIYKQVECRTFLKKEEQERIKRNLSRVCKAIKEEINAV